ncbi:RusA family crossover junction endodeoxyribonuclease [Skermanella aerolata]|nr:RusA family crossover junction endodeoxyribonuclease [Skermanella aerolata]
MSSMEGMAVELDFPLEFVVSGTAVSHQAKRRESVDRWKSRIRDATVEVLPEGHFATGGPVSVTLFYFPGSEMAGDIDNIVKPILDALCQHIYMDDDQVERVLVQKFEPEKMFQFGSPSSILEGAIVGDKPLLYVRLSDNPFEELE